MKPTIRIRDGTLQIGDVLHYSPRIQLLSGRERRYIMWSGYGWIDLEAVRYGALAFLVVCVLWGYIAYLAAGGIS